MKKNYLLLLGAFTAFTVNAQTIVNTGTGNKHAILEEFTGIKCSNCPAGHTEAANIKASNPSTVHVIAYGPSNSSYTNPSGTSGTDFRRTFANAFYTGTYCSPASGSRFMPSAFINRKLIGGNILQSRTAWASNVTSTLAESADLNIGLKSTYNAANQELVIDVEVYYLSNVTASNSLYVLISEDGLTSTYQSGTSTSAANPYTYNHLFRENVTTGQWGDAITGSTTQGSTYTKQFTFDLSNTTDPINISNAHVLAFVVNGTSSNKEIYNGISVEADGGLASTGSGTVNVNEIANTNKFSMYPNPTNANTSISFNLENESNVSLEVYNTVGSLVYSENKNNMSAGKQKINFDGTEFPQGIYFVNLTIGNEKVTRKLTIQK